VNRAISVFKPAGEKDSTFDNIVEQLATGIIELAEGDFAKNTGVPKVASFNKAFGTSLDAKAIAEIWAKVEELRELAGSRLKAVGLDALAAALEIDVEEIDLDLDGFPEPEGTDEESGEPIYDVETVREFFTTTTATKE